MTTNIGPIPEWDEWGLLPPYLGDPTDSSRSPYRVSPTDLVLRFGTTVGRRNLLKGLLDFRAALHQIGLSRGFQWVNGSFVEDKTLREVQKGKEPREPNDIDVVTFFHLPDGYSEEDFIREHSNLLDHANLRRQYGIDSFWENLDGPLRHLSRAVVYWSSLWSHTREHQGLFQWKGYLEIDLSDQYDPMARAVLIQKSAEATGESD